MRMAWPNSIISWTIRLRRYCYRLHVLGKDTLHFFNHLIRSWQVIWLLKLRLVVQSRLNMFHKGGIVQVCYGCIAFVLNHVLIIFYNSYARTAEFIRQSIASRLDLSVNLGLLFLQEYYLARIHYPRHFLFDVRLLVALRMFLDDT